MPMAQPNLLAVAARSSPSPKDGNWTTPKVTPHISSLLPILMNGSLYFVNGVVNDQFQQKGQLTEVRGACDPLFKVPIH